jgi:calcium-dependent protein kinase
VFDRRHWRHASELVKDLLEKMLAKNPKKRPSARDCLKHPWFSL